MMEVTYFMQLIYLWLDMKSRGIENLELQLSPNHHCKFDCEKKELKIEYDAKMLNIFSEKYSNIKNISVIVGENGCGKTTILEEMFDLLRYDSLSSIYLAIYYDENAGNGVYYWHSNIGKKIKDYSINIICHDNYKCINLNSEQIEDELFVVRYTDILNLDKYAKRDMLSTRNSCDLTKAYRCIAMNKNGIVNNKHRDSLLELYHDETKRQLQAISDKTIPFSVQELVMIPCKEIDVNYLDNSVIDLKWQIIENQQTAKTMSIKEKARNLCKEIIYNVNSWENMSMFDVVVRTIIYTYLRRQITAYNLWNNEHLGPGIMAAIDREINTTISYWLQNIDDFRERQNIEEIQAFFSESFEEVVLPGTPNIFCINMQKFINILFQNKYVSYNKDSMKFYINMNKIEYSELMELYQCYKNSIGQYGEAFSFELGMSSGERAFLNLISYMNYAKKMMKDADNIHIIRENGNRSTTNRFVIFLIDEIDAQLHPRWQQNIIQVILDNLSKSFSEHEVQIILTTHSPILLSDIPVGHVTYLEKGKDHVLRVVKKEQSFAENIYCLYRSSFFLQKDVDDNSPWIMGSFARYIIKDICKELKEIDNNISEVSNDFIKVEQQLDYVEKVIDLIGNTVMKKILQNKFKKTYEKFMARKNGGKTNYKIEIVKKYMMEMTAQERERIGTIIKTMDGV